MVVSPQPQQEPDEQNVEPSRGPSPLNPNLVYSGLVVAVSIATLRAGLSNLVLVVTLSALLLCNPWVRTLLELPSTGTKVSLSKFDPAKYLTLAVQLEPSPTDALESVTEPVSNVSDSLLDAKKLSLNVMPLQLRNPTRHLIDLVVRDFVRFWYDPITFAHPGFPKQSHACISHLASSIYLRSRYMKSVDVASELLLTTQSVILASLRRKRISNQTATVPIDETNAETSHSQTAGLGEFSWPSSTARIESLRKAVHKLLSRNTLARDRQSPLVMTLMTEILTKQLWQVVQHISDPDFINLQIVQWGEPASETSLETQTIPVPELEQNLSCKPMDGFPIQNEPPDLVRPTVDSRTTSSAPSTATTPLASMVGLASSALNTVADATERVVEKVGAAVGEAATSLVDVGSSSNPSSQQPIGTASGTLNDFSRPMYLDMPKDVPEPIMPGPIRASLGSNQPQQDTDPQTAYIIPDYEYQTAPLSSKPPFDSSKPLSASIMSPSTSSQSLASVSSSSSSSSPDVFPSLQTLLSEKRGTQFDAFENFIEHPTNPYCGSNEGETLIRLETQLATLSTIMEFASLDQQTFRADTTGILSKALDSLPLSVPNTFDGQPSISVRRTVVETLTRLEQHASLDILDPLKRDIFQRLEQLYRAFVVIHLQKALHRRPSENVSMTKYTMHRSRSTGQEGGGSSWPSTSSSSSSHHHHQGNGGSKPLTYEPRRKNTGPSSSSNVNPSSAVPIPSRPPSVPPRPPSTPPRSSFIPPPPLPRRPSSSSIARTERSQSMSSSLSNHNSQPRTSMSSEQQQQDSNKKPCLTATDGGAAMILITDVSPNAEKSTAVDLRTFEVMIAVEGLSESGDGFVLLRRWMEFETLDGDLQRIPRSTSPPPRLPSGKGKNSIELCRSLETYLFELLVVSPGRSHLMSNASVQQFLDKTRAGASAGTVKEKGGGPATFFGGIGKNIVSGMGAVGKSARNGLGLQASSFSLTGESSGDGIKPSGSSATNLLFKTGSTMSSSNQGTEERLANSKRGGTDEVEGFSPIPESTTSSGFPSRPTTPSTELSAKDLDSIVSSIFAVADEAFNLQGGWTLRRGMLRVLEQVVRTTYSSSVVATFNNGAASLNLETFSKWIEYVCESFWPNHVWSIETYPQRCIEDKIKTKEKARQIVISYAPVQAGYLLGPGGRLACVNALATVHETVVDPVTASDLGLTMVLKLLDLVGR